MQPTMKLRIVKRKSLYKGDPYMISAYDGEYFVLQQWWAKIIPGPGNVVQHSTDGEWRDIPIQEEQTGNNS